MKDVDWVAIAFGAAVMTLFLVLAFIAWQAQQGYNAWVEQLTAISGQVVCTTKDSYLIEVRK